MLHRSPFGRVLLKVESFVGMLFAWFVGLLVVFLLVAIWFGSAVEYLWLVPFTAPVALFALVVELSMFVATWRALYQSDAIAISTAKNLKPWPIILRPIVSLWWLGHFLFGVFAAVMLEVSSTDSGSARTTGMKPPPTGFLMVMCFGLTFAGNIFLTLAAASVTRRDAVLRRVWSLRLLIDAAVIMAPAIIKQIIHRQD